MMLCKIPVLAETVVALHKLSQTFGILNYVNGYADEVLPLNFMTFAYTEYRMVMPPLQIIASCIYIYRIDVCVCVGGGGGERERGERLRVYSAMLFFFFFSFFCAFLFVLFLRLIILRYLTGQKLTIKNK